MRDKTKSPLTTLPKALRMPLAGALALSLAAGIGPLAAQDAGSKAPAAAAPAEPAATADAPASSFSEAQQNDIKRIIRDYFVKNPEVMLEVQAALEARMEEIQAARLKEQLKSNAEALFRDPDAPVAGDPNGDVTVVEFFDYNCGYCKRGFPDVAKLIKDDPKVRVVFRELPILSKGSEEAARIALAAHMQGKYWEFHSRMIEFKGQANEASALNIAEKAGLDMAKLKTDMASDKVEGEIKKVRDLAQKLGVNGTPHFIVGNHSIPGAPQDLVEQLKANVADVRKNGCTVC